MKKSMIKQVQDMAIKEYSNAELILTDRNSITLRVYDDDVNTHNFITGMDNNYNNYYSMKNTAQPTKTTSEPMQPMNMAPVIPIHPLPSILQKITNKRGWTTTLYTRKREWGLLKRHQSWTG